MGYIDLSPNDWDRIEAMLESAFTPAQLSAVVQTRFPDLHRHVPWREPFATISHRLTDVANRRGLLVDLLRAATAKLAADPLAYRPDLADLAEELASRPTTTPPPEEQADARVPIRHTLPPPVPDFTGRAADIEKLVSHLRTAGPVAGIRGMGGIGKTQLALAVAQQLRDDYPGQVMFELQPGDAPLAPDAVLGRVIHAFQPDLKLPADLEELQHICRGILVSRRGLLLLDNALDAKQVKPLLPPPPGWAIIVTSRARFPLAGGCLHDVDLLAPDEAVGLLGRMLSDGGRDDLAGEDLAPLAEACGRLPLALRLAAGYLTSYANRTLASYLSALGKARLKHLTAPDEQKPLRAVLGLSVDRLRETSAQAAQGWHDLAAFPAPFDALAAAAVWEMAEDEAEDALGRLVQQSLVEHDAGTYRVHDLLREVALETPLHDAVRQRHAAHYLAQGIAANELYLTAGGHLAGLHTLDQGLPHLLYAWQQLKEGDSPATLQWLSNFPGLTGAILDLRVRPIDRIAILQCATAAARKLGVRDQEAVHLSNLGIAYADSGQIERATDCYQQALAISRAFGDHRGESTHLGNLGNAYYQLGQIDRAIQYYERALALSQEIGDRRQEGICLGNLGLAHADSGQVKRAIDSYEQALAISREIGDRREEGSSLGNLGVAYWDLGQSSRAITYYEQALTISREIGDRSNEARWLGNLGITHAAQGQTERAIEFYRLALAIDQDIGNRRGEGIDLDNLGVAFEKLGQTSRAIEFYEQALAISQEIGDRRGEEHRLGNLGNAFLDLRRPERAIDHYEQALAIAREINDRRGETNALGSLGNAYADLGQLGQAIDCHERALVIAREIGDRHGEAKLCWNLGLHYHQAGALRHAAEVMEICVNYEREIGHPDAEADAEAVAAIRRQTEESEGEASRLA